MSKKYLIQSEHQTQAAISQPVSGFVAFGAKADGLYQRKNGQNEEKLAVEKVIIIQQIAHGFSVGNCIKLNGSTWVKAKADTAANAGTVGLVSEVIDANNFKYMTGGLLSGTYTHGALYFLSTTTAGEIVIQSDPEIWDIGNVREFIGTGTPEGLLVEIDLGQVITEAIVPVSIWDLTGINRTGWAEGKVLKFDANGNLIVGVDLQGDQQTGIQLADLSAAGAISYNNTTGVFSIAPGFSVPTTTEKGNYDNAFGWGNHANAGYLKAITKAMVEGVLTGVINSHGHNYDNYECWLFNIGGNYQAVYSNNQMTQHTVTMAAGLGMAVEYSWYFGEHVCTYKLNINSLTNIVNPTLNHSIAIQGGGDPSRITLDQLKTLIGGGGGTSDHGSLGGLADDDHQQYYNQTRGDARYAQKAGSSSQDFAVKNLTAAETIVATGTITGSEVYRGSARKLKKNIRPLKINALKIVDSIKLYGYQLKADNSRAIGFIADETDPILSGESRDRHLFGNHLTVLTKAIQEQQQQITSLKKELEEMKELIKKINHAR